MGCVLEWCVLIVKVCALFEQVVGLVVVCGLGVVGDRHCCGEQCWVMYGEVGGAEFVVGVIYQCLGVLVGVGLKRVGDCYLDIVG